MKGTDIQEILAEEQQIQRHKDALDSLVHRRSQLLRESLEERMRRAQDRGYWSHLSQQECAEYHQEEKQHLESQVERLRHEQARTKRKLAELKRMKAQAELIRAAQVESERKRH
jgi:hypothetical protein